MLSFNSINDIFPAKLAYFFQEALSSRFLKSDFGYFFSHKGDAH